MVVSSGGITDKPPLYNDNYSYSEDVQYLL